MEKELVSIITPMYKGAAFVGETIQSVLAQGYKNWEMIIVDDCSPDDGAGIREVKNYTEDPRIILVESKDNRGSSGARNIARQKAKGRYIAFLDSDDIWHPDFLEKQMKFMKKKDAPLVLSSYKRIDENTKEELVSPFIVP
ncbi:MAG: glycosyltransferase, partial [Muribaculaceae bacterium]|nr:glycosyltransferase [Muribaculaceae bacterium]